MKKVLLTFVFTSLIFVGVNYAQTPPPATPAPTTAAPTVVVAHHEHHPEIHKAMRRLRAAKDDLEKASHDYGGHRVKAIAAIDAALGELKEALAFDKS